MPWAGLARQGTLLLWGQPQAGVGIHRSRHQRQGHCLDHPDTLQAPRASAQPPAPIPQHPHFLFYMGPFAPDRVPMAGPGPCPQLQQVRDPHQGEKGNELPAPNFYWNFTWLRGPLTRGTGDRSHVPTQLPAQGGRPCAPLLPPHPQCQPLGPNQDRFWWVGGQLGVGKGGKHRQWESGRSPRKQTWKRPSAPRVTLQSGTLRSGEARYTQGERSAWPGTSPHKAKEGLPPSRAGSQPWGQRPGTGPGGQGAL